MIDLGAIDFFEWMAIFAMGFLLFGIIKITLYSYNKEKNTSDRSSSKYSAVSANQQSVGRFQAASVEVSEEEENKIQLVEIKKVEGVRVRGHIYSYSKKKKPVFIGQVEEPGGSTPLTTINEEEFDLDLLIKEVRDLSQEKKTESR